MKSVQDGHLKSASSPSYFIMTINMNSPKKRVAEKRRKFLSIVMRSFFSSVISCQELPGYFEEEVVAECGASGYDYVETGKESAVMWRKEDFDGETTGLKTTDTWIRELRGSLGSDASELLSRIALVKLTSKASKQVVLAASWHGPHNNSDDEKKILVFDCLTAFLAKVVEEKEIPSYIIGGDFNLDTIKARLPDNVVVSNYELSPRQTQKQEKSHCYIPHKDNFVLFPNKELRVCYARPFLFEDEGTTTSDFSKDDQAKVEAEMANAATGDTSANPTDMLDHDPIISVIQFTSSSSAVKNLSKDFEGAL